MKCRCGTDMKPAGAEPGRLVCPDATCGRAITLRDAGMPFLAQPGHGLTTVAPPAEWRDPDTHYCARCDLPFPRTGGNYPEICDECLTPKELAYRIKRRAESRAYEEKKRAGRKAS